MKQNFGLRIVIILTVILSLSIISVSAQKSKINDKRNSTESLGAGGVTLLVEDFPYAEGSLLTNNGWSAHSAAGTNAIATASPGLTLTGYESSGVGNTANMTVSGEDLDKSFATQTTGTVYAAFMVNASEASTTSPGGYFFHLGGNPVGTVFRGRVWIVKDGSNNVAFGISKLSTSEVTLTPFSFALNTTYLVVVKYTIVEGDTNDTVDLFVSTTVPATEPAPTISATDVTASDIAPGTVSLRQGSTATHPTVKVDGIRVGTTWTSVTGPAMFAQSTADSDFDGDGKTDISVFRPSEGNWYLQQSTAGFGVINFGLSTDTIVPEDYDGDGKADTAIFRPSDTMGVSDFYILNSNGFTLSGAEWGISGDVPVIADYTGDGKADIAVFRPINGTWYIINSEGGTTIEPFGLTTDIPLALDTDGDGKANLAAFRPSENTWYVARPTGTPATNFDAFPFGTAGDILAPADYNGDNRDDIAVFRPSNGTWYILDSETLSTTFTPFGAGGDIPVPGDYDGDSKADIAIYRNGEWWINGSTSGVSVSNFGLVSDMPVPYSYLP